MSIPNQNDVDALLANAILGVAWNQGDALEQTGSYQRVEGAALGTVAGGAVWMAVDAYDGPEGKGYVVRCRYTLAGTIYRTVHQFGPETWRAHPWRQMPQYPPLP